MVKMVRSVGTTTSPVSIICRNLKPTPCSGSMNRWCMPTGRLAIRNRMKLRRPIMSL
jgi:hypothetical protein